MLPKRHNGKINDRYNFFPEKQTGRLRYIMYYSDSLQCVQVKPALELIPLPLFFPLWPLCWQPQNPFHFACVEYDWPGHIWYSEKDLPVAHSPHQPHFTAKKLLWQHHKVAAASTISSKKVALSMAIYYFPINSAHWTRFSGKPAFCGLQHMGLNNVASDHNS